MNGTFVLDRVLGPDGPGTANWWQTLDSAYPLPDVIFEGGLSPGVAIYAPCAVYELPVALPCGFEYMIMAFSGFPTVLAVAPGGGFGFVDKAVPGIQVVWWVHKPSTNTWLQIANNVMFGETSPTNDGYPQKNTLQFRAFGNVGTNPNQFCFVPGPLASKPFQVVTALV